MKLGDGTVALTNLSHIGIAVKDVEKTIGFISSVWDIGTPEIVEEYTPKQEEMIAGKPFSLKIAFIKFGTVVIELLQPLDRGSIWSDFIETKGEGIHHVAWGVSNYDELVSKLQAQGHPMLVAASYDGVRWCYFDTSPGGMVIEFREEYKIV